MLITVECCYNWSVDKICKAIISLANLMRHSWLPIGEGVNMLEINPLLVPPKYCKYASGECNQSFNEIKNSEAFFIYPSNPPHLANTIKEAVAVHQRENGKDAWLTWEDLKIGGKVIFCEICKVMRGSQLIVAIEI